jgi:hypothetical protein
VSVEAGRSIVLTVDPMSDLDSMVAQWLSVRSTDAIFSTAILASPVRDGGATEQVLAIDGLTDLQIEELIGELALVPVSDTFRSRR